jgi:hypothetical protein
MNNCFGGCQCQAPLNPPPVPEPGEEAVGEIATSCL